MIEEEEISKKLLMSCLNCKEHIANNGPCAAKPMCRELERYGWRLRKCR